MTYTRMILEACSDIGGIFTPQDIYEGLLAKGVSIKKGTVKRILVRLLNRGYLGREGRGIYFFVGKGDNCNQKRGQKGTDEGVCNHSKQNKDTTGFPYKRGQKNDYSGYNHSKPSILRRVCAFFYNFHDRPHTIKEIYSIFNEDSKIIPRIPYRTIQSAFNYLLREGIIYRVERGVYRLTSREVADAWLSRVTPPAPQKRTGMKFKLPSFNLHGRRIGKVITITEEVWRGLQSKQSSVSPLFVKKPPKENDDAQQWTFETENAKFVISAKTLKTVIYPKTEDWLKDVSEHLGGWAVRELKGAKATMHAAINKREFERYRAGVISVVEDHSEYGKDGDIEFHGPEEAVKTAMGLTLTGLFTPEQSATIADLLHTYTEKQKIKIEELRRELEAFERFTIEELDHLRREIKSDRENLTKQIDLLKSEIREHFNTIAGGLRILIHKPEIDFKKEVEGYA